MKEIIQKAIQGGWNYLIAIPKADTILIWLHQKAQYLGIKESVLNRLENVMLAAILAHASSLVKSTTTMSAINTTGISNSMDISLAIQRLQKNLKQLNLDGLAKSLGIIKESVTRLIWLLGDVRNTSNGSGLYSSEMTSLVRNAVLKERILKQTITPLDFQSSWTKKESEPTSKQWRVNDYGIKKMEGHFVGSVTGGLA